MNARVRRAALLCAGLCAGGPALAQEGTVRAPVFTSGDSWVFEQTTEKGTAGFQQMRLSETIERLDGQTMVVGVKPDGAPTGPVDQVMGQDWSKRHVVDGEQSTTARPFDFPMKAGKSWTAEWQDTTRRGNQLSLHVHRTYRVVGWQDVTVPAGTFHALKVEAKGVDEGMIEVPSVAVAGAAVEPGSGATFSNTHRGGRGRLTRSTYSAFYYVPALRNFVQSVDEQYNSDDVLVSRLTLKLVSWSPGRG